MNNTRLTDNNVIPKKLAFVKRGKWSNTNASVLSALSKEFPHFQIETVTMLDLLYADNDVEKLLVGSPALNWCFAMKEFAGPILSGRKKIKNCLPRTTYAFRKYKDAVGKYLANKSYAFTFQTQNLFDASIPGTPHFVYTDHCNLATLQYPGYGKADLWADSCVKLERTVYQNASLIFSMSKNIEKWLVEKYSCDPGKVICVYAGSNAKVMPYMEINANIDRYARKRILFVGTNWEAKGGPELIEAFKAVSRVHPEAQLKIVGCSPNIHVRNCNVVGRIPLSEMSKYYADASVFCLPTRIESFGISFIEAFAHKLPVIGTNLGAIPEFVVDGENGYLVGSRDVANLKEKLFDLLSSPRKCQVFGENGYGITKKTFNWGKVGAKMRKNIDRVISTRRT